MNPFIPQSKDRDPLLESENIKSQIVDLWIKMISSRINSAMTAEDLEKIKNQISDLQRFIS
jgi:predicted transcriptional regulator